MKGKRRAWAAGLAVLVVGVAGSASESDEEEQVRQRLIEMWKAIGDGDLTGYASCLHLDFTQFGENDVYLAVGKDLELRSMADFLSRARSVHTEMHQPRITVRGDVAWVVYYWTDRGSVDGRPYATRGKSTRIFVKEGGRWLCIHGHYTAVP